MTWTHGGGCFPKSWSAQLLPTPAARLRLTSRAAAAGGRGFGGIFANGWWPWYWWNLRDWQVDPYLVKEIAALVKQNPRIGRLPRAIPAPSLDVFQPLLAAAAKTTRSGVLARVARPAANLADGAVDPNALNGLREQLADLLPREFPLPIWPWYPWYPWLECGANLIFKATQVCSGQTSSIVAETVADTRWDISGNLSVTLIANDQACCVYSCGLDCPEGNWVVPSDL